MYRSLGFLLIALTMMVGACTSGDDGVSGAPEISKAWLNTVDEQWEADKPTSSVPILDLTKKCELDIEVTIDGTHMREQGSGPSGLPDGGRRYVCEFADPASMSLDVGRYPTAEQARDEVYGDTAEDREGAEFKISGTSIFTEHTGSGANSTFTAGYLDEDAKAFASIRLTPYKELKDWDSKKTAELLVSILQQS